MSTTFLQCDFTATDDTLLQDYVENGSDTGCTFAHPTTTGYQPTAVHFDGNQTLISTGNLTAASSSQGFLSLWFRAYDGSFGNDYLLLQKSGTGGYLVDIYGSFGRIPWKFGLNLQDDDAGTNNYFNEYQTTVGTGWHHMLIAWDVGFTHGNRRVAFYVDDVLYPGDGLFETGGAINVPNGSMPFSICASGDVTPSTVGDYADVFVWYGSTIVQADSTIHEIDRRKFIDVYGHPVNPSGALSAYGTPVAQFQGDHTNFATNQGSGGTFTLTGSLTNASSPPAYGDALILDNHLTIVERSFPGSQTSMLYEVATAPGSDYSVQFAAIQSDPTTIVANGSSLYAVLRADSQNDGYKIGVQTSGGQFQLFVTIDTDTSTTVNAGTGTGESFTVFGTVQGNQISAALQRSSDSFWLQSDASWDSIQANAIAITDSTFSSAGNVLIGGSWIT